MPLIKSSSNKARSENIATEIKAGKDPRQAAAIGYAVQRKNKDADPALTRRVDAAWDAFQSAQRRGDLAEAKRLRVEWQEAKKVLEKSSRREQVPTGNGRSMNRSDVSKVTKSLLGWKDSSAGVRRTLARGSRDAYSKVVFEHHSSPVKSSGRVALLSGRGDDAGMYQVRIEGGSKNIYSNEMIAAQAYEKAVAQYNKDMSPKDWEGLEHGLSEFFKEEQREPEHKSRDYRAVDPKLTIVELNRRNEEAFHRRGIAKDEDNRSPFMRMVWDVLEAAKDNNDQAVAAACRRIIEANRRGQQKSESDVRLVKQFGDW